MQLNVHSKVMDRFAQFAPWLNGKRYNFTPYNFEKNWNGKEIEKNKVYVIGRVSIIYNPGMHSGKRL